MPPISAILFDAGNTLIYADPERLADILRSTGAVTDARRVAAAEMEARRGLHACIQDGCNGTEPEVWQDYFTDIFRLAGVPDEGMAEAGRLLWEVHSREHLWTHVAPGTEATLVELRDAGYRLAVISNADGRMEGVLQEVGLRPHFEFVMDSEVVGMEKPDPEIFLEGARRLESEPRKCLYVGDLFPVDYLGATRAGLQAVLLDPLGLHDGRAPSVPDLNALPAFLGGQAGAPRDVVADSLDSRAHPRPAP